MREESRHWIETDRTHCWHPFTRQDDWCAAGFEPVVITHGEGVWLWDSEGRTYLDANSSIWTNIHGHRHPHIDQAIRDQLDRVAHTSFLGFTHPPAIELATRLCGFFPDNTLERVFYSDDGSTAVECALKMAAQYRRQTGEPERTGFLAFAHGYHGDTLGAASLGGVSRFFEKIRHLGYPARHVGSTADLTTVDASTIAAVILEPVIQGVNEMRPWPPGMLGDLRAWCDARGVHLILDEVMTGFGRTGTMFACQQENVIPDFLCLAKGLTAGYLPMAATLTTGAIYEAFRGDAANAFYYGHSYTANPLGCAAALASLDVFESERTLAGLPAKSDQLRSGLEQLKAKHPRVHDIRGIGLAFGLELRQPDGTRFPPRLRTGEAFCHTARRHRLLTRPILDTIVVMPPLSITTAEIDLLLQSLDSTLAENQGIDTPPPHV
jgi:adenosylmethionine-8-amino-7-oxononanoate aminotransferase